VDPHRKRQIRLVVALGVAVLLSVALIYTSFSAADEAKQPSELLHGATGSNVEMTGEVVKGSVRRRAGDEESLSFRVVDREAEGRGQSLPVVYTGTVPDPFRGGREIVLDGEVAKNGVFVGERGTLVTKCPSKFTAANEG
jgi:cytochrome c-type biogenesis protein CcmE